MSTVQHIIDRAVERSNLNDIDLIPTDELVAYVSSYERGVYLMAARLNPDYFGLEGNTAVRGSATATWDISGTPGNIAAVSKLEVQTITGSVTGISMGDDVNIISIRNPEHALAPRVYLRSRTIHEYNSELQDDASNYVTRLKIYYSYLPSERSTVSDSLSLPSEWNDLLILPLASLLAIRDQRPDETQPLQQKYVEKIAEFANAVSVYDEGTIRDLGQIIAAYANLPGAE